MHSKVIPQPNLSLIYFCTLEIFIPNQPFKFLTELLSEKFENNLLNTRIHIIGYFAVKTLVSNFEM